MPRHKEPPHCEWPRSTCNQPPLPPDHPRGAVFCADHYKAWALIMESLIAGIVLKTERASPGER
jgi:hypothetical protein